jgi:hypothetical protein
MMHPSKEPINVTDHAICRYLERAYGFNVEAIREHIAGLCAAPAAFGAERSVRQSPARALRGDPR